jgi:hypothetical protein
MPSPVAPDDFPADRDGGVAHTPAILGIGNRAEIFSLGPQVVSAQACVHGRQRSPVGWNGCRRVSGLLRMPVAGTFQPTRSGFYRRERCLEELIGELTGSLMLHTLGDRHATRL